MIAARRPNRQFRGAEVSLACSLCLELDTAPLESPTHAEQTQQAESGRNTPIPRAEKPSPSPKGARGGRCLDRHDAVTS